MKYIIKNCPAYSTFYPDTGAEHFIACNAGLPLKKCQDCTDCLLKQIVEKCMYEAHGDAWQIIRAGDVFLANDILRLLDIQEIEE